MGVERMRLPMARKIALPTAGPTGPAGGSPSSEKRSWPDRPPKMDIHLRRVTSAQDRILVEIALDHPPILYIDLFVQRHVEPEDYPALDQVQCGVAIDHTAAIERGV